jgi:predicted ATPase/DNA-binding SARP family transcriptional activator
VTAAKRGGPSSIGGGRIRLEVLGAPRLRIDGVEKPFKAPPSALPLLATLVLARGDGIRRDTLAAWLWPERLDEEARADLRRHVHYIERALRDAGVTESPIARVGKNLRIDVPIETDVADFERYSRSDAKLAEAVALYRGDLLDGCEADWLQPERERLRKAHLANVSRLVDWYAARDDFTNAIHWATELTRAEPYREDFFAKRVRLLFRSGDAAAGWSALRAFEQLLREELGVAPSAETLRLVETSARRGEKHLPLPPEPTRFFGRESDVIALSQLLETHDVVTCIGSPGVGKTRLAARVAANVDVTFSAGVIWLVVGFGEQAGELQDTVRAAVEAAGGQFNRASSNRSRILPEFLVVLDNCEHDIDECARTIVALRRTSPHLRFLARSRSPLGVAGEALWLVKPLEVPSPAVEFFLDRARLARADFDERTVSRDALLNICRRLEGVPLALEVAAARLRSMSVGELARRLSEGFRLIAGDVPSSAERDPLTAAFAMSYRLMGEQERAMFRAVAIFRGGWTVEAAAAVAGNDEWTTIDLLARLVDRSVIVAPPVDGEGRRYSMLHSLREFALERARECGEFDRNARRHATFFANTYTAMTDELNEATDDRHFPSLESERENINAALATLLIDKSDPELGMRLCVALIRFWFTRGHVREAEHWTGTALALAQPDSELRLQLLNTHAISLRNQSDSRAARDRFVEASALAERLGSAVRSATNSLHAADCERTLGEYASAERRVDAAYAVFESAGERYLLAYALTERGLIAADQGRLADASRLHRESLRIFEEEQAKVDAAMCFANLAHCAFLGGDAAAADRLAAEALKRAEASGTPFVAAGAHLVLGETALARSDRREAYAQLAKTLEIALDLNDIERCAEALELGAHLFSFVGKDAVAACLCGAADALRERCGARRRPQTAARQARLVETLGRHLGESTFEIESLRGRGLTSSQAPAFLNDAWNSLVVVQTQTENAGA